MIEGVGFDGKTWSTWRIATVYSGIAESPLEGATELIVTLMFVFTEVADTADIEWNLKYCNYELPKQTNLNFRVYIDRYKIVCDS